MLRNAQPFIFALGIAILLIVALDPTSADKPAVPDQSARGDQPTLADRPAAPVQNRIRQALEGNIDQRKTDDGVLNDVLDVIKQRGSILDGSSLDDQKPTAERETASLRDKAYVAEQLLSSSRLLESLGSLDKNRKTLIRQMRSEAVKLLSD